MGARKILKKKQESCNECKRIRLQVCERLMGPSFQELSHYKHLPVWAAIHFDIAGPMKQKITRKQSGKIYLLICTCLSSRFCVFIPLPDYTANSVLSGLKQASMSVGCSLPFIAWTDHANNFSALNKAEGEVPMDVENRDKTLEQLKTLFTSNGVTLKQNPGYSQWRNSLAESIVKICKVTMKRLGYYNMKLTFPQYSFLCSQIGFIVNQRPLNVTFQNDTLITLTPSKLLFGSKLDVLPQTLLTLTDKNDLFGQLKELDENTKLFREQFYHEYLSGLRKFRKFRKNTRDLKIGDICYLADKINPETGKLTLCIVHKILSDRTFTVRYFKKKPKLDPSNFNITDSGKISYIDRAAQSLIFLGSSKDENISTEYIDVEILQDTMDRNYLDVTNDNFPFESQNVVTPSRDNIEDDMIDDLSQAGLLDTNIQDVFHSNQNSGHDIQKIQDQTLPPKMEKPSLVLKHQNIDSNIIDLPKTNKGRVKRK